MGMVIMITLMCTINYLGTVTTAKCAEVGEIAFNSKWYQFPNELQKYISPIVQQSHKPINFHGFRVVLCTLETLMKVDLNNTDFSIKFLLIINRLYSC